MIPVMSLAPAFFTLIPMNIVTDGLIVLDRQPFRKEIGSMNFFAKFLNYKSPCFDRTLVSPIRIPIPVH
jgi:hypothetical protein